MGIIIFAFLAFVIVSAIINMSRGNRGCRGGSGFSNDIDSSGINDSFSDNNIFINNDAMSNDYYDSSNDTGDMSGDSGYDSGYDPGGDSGCDCGCDSGSGDSGSCGGSCD